MTSIASSAAAGPPPGMRVRLSSNESPWGPSPAALAAVRATTDELFLYPDDQSTQLRRAIARAEDASLDQVMVGTGSAGVLMDLIVQQCAAGGTVVAYERSFVVYRLAARNASVPYVEVPTGGPATHDADGYARDPERLLAEVDDDTAVVVIDNPGNPTGAHLGADALAAVVEGTPDHVTLVIDEAYWQYAASGGDYARARDLAVSHPRLVVASTFSKAHALAGLRVGYLVGAEDVVSAVDAWRARFDVNAVAQAAAVASLGDLDHVRTTVAETLVQRERMATALRGLNVPFTNGLGNFLTVEVGDDAMPVVAAFAEHGVGVRPLTPYGMTSQVRISVGTGPQTDELLEAAADVLSAVPSRS